MKQLFFFIGFIWPLASLGSLLIGPFVGLDRSQLKRDLIDFWNAKEKSQWSTFASRAALVFSLAGFLFPVVFPIFGVIVGLVFFVLFALI